ncbi:MAG: phage holin family protein [Burkholderiales bacterium]|nr:phage holin family protein [Burkholderiales bacterium]
MAEGQRGATREPGLLAALRRLAATAVELARTRLELLAAELDEERSRVVRLLLLALGACFFAALGIVTLTFFIIMLAWDSNRLLAAGLLAAAYIGIGAVFAFLARAAARERSRLFAASLAELRKDRDALG